MIQRIQNLVSFYKSAQSTRSNYGIVTLLKILDCKASLPNNTKSETPTNKQTAYSKSCKIF